MFHRKRFRLATVIYTGPVADDCLSLGRRRPLLPTPVR